MQERWARGPRAPGALGVIAVAPLLACLSCVSAPPPGTPPRLVLVVAVDQLRSDRLDPGLPGGLGRLAREGRVFAEAAHAHADTSTCPGHASMLTGRHPGPAGIPGNAFVERDTLRTQYCVADDSPDAAVIGGERGGRSPRNLRVTALGDWMKAAHPGTRVFSVSGKDRAAIALGGRRPDAAYWMDWRSGGFTTSRYYLDELPGWVTQWRFPGLPPAWEHASGHPPNGARRDDYPAEDPRYGRTSPHPLEFVAQLAASPFGDELALDFARTLVEAERLGRSEHPDLLALGLSSTDAVGHLWGPESQEARDALRRLDAALGSFLGALERRLGRGRVLVVLTSDHGVLPLPEWLQEQGRSECPLEGGRRSWDDARAAVAAALEAEFGAPGSTPWLAQYEASLTVNRALAEARGVEVEAVIALARDHLAREPGVARVWTGAEIAAGAGPEPFAVLYRNSRDPERSGDLVVQPLRDCLFSSLEFGTSHGSPYAYDREVPVVFFGAGVEAGIVRGPAAPVDIGPTLAAALGIPAPPELDGRVLSLRPPTAPVTGTSR